MTRSFFNFKNRASKSRADERQWVREQINAGKGGSIKSGNKRKGAKAHDGEPMGWADNLAAIVALVFPLSVVYIVAKLFDII